MQTVTTNLDNHILTVTLHRPEQLNAFNEQMMEELLTVYEAANENDDVRVIIVTGSGKAFCAGMDLTQGENAFASDEEQELFRDMGGRVSLVVHELKKPIIAAINGAAIGIGITMTLPMDIRIVKKEAKIGFIFGKRGIGPEAASGWFLTKHIGIGKALEWLYSGRIISSAEALAAGLVQYEVDDPYAKAYELAQEIVANTSAVSNAFSRQLLWSMHVTEHPLTSHLVESRFLHWIATSPDVKEGIDSFFEKRPAKFEMKVSELPNFVEMNLKTQ